MNILIKKPSAWIPLALSALSFTMIAVHVSVFGITNGSGDEGIVARIFQFIVAIQVLTTLLFAMKWIPQAQSDAIKIFVIQIVAIAVPIILIIVLEK